MFLIIAVLLLATSAMAEVKITCSQSGNVITVAYDATSEVNLPRAFALDISLVDTKTRSYVIFVKKKNSNPNTMITMINNVLGNIPEYLQKRTLRSIKYSFGFQRTVDDQF